MFLGFLLCAFGLLVIPHFFKCRGVIVVLVADRASHTLVFFFGVSLAILGVFSLPNTFYNTFLYTVSSWVLIVIMLYLQIKYFKYF